MSAAAPPTANGPIIRLTDLVKDYVQADLTTHVLKGISLEITPGQFVALQGPSGSGKSTLLHILGLLESPTSGSYVLQGVDVAGMDDDHRSELRNQLFGFVFQSFYLIPYASALDNVLLPGLYGDHTRAALVERGMELLETVGLTDRATFRPGQLSGGQQQRVALARALLNKPSIIFADEPTGQLDSTTSREIMELLTRINAGGTTVVMVTHDEDTASYASSAIHLGDGRIANIT